MMSWLLLYGNSYSEIQRDQAGRIAALWPVAPTRVTPFREEVPSTNGRKRYGPLKYKIDGQTIVDAADLLHIRGLGFDGTVGYSVVARARQCIALGISQENFSASMVGNSCQFGGVLSTPVQIDETQKTEIREAIEGLHQGADQVGKFLVLGGDFKYARLGMSMEDAEWIASRKFQKSEIAMFFGLPPHKIGDLERATFANVESEELNYYKSALRHHLINFEQACNRSLVPSLERSQQFVEFSLDGFLRGDSAGRAALYQALFQLGAISSNEIRAKENLNPVPGGDVLWIPLNMAPAETTAALAKLNLQEKDV
jgi:HK97 family phage portal protein